MKRILERRSSVWVRIAFIGLALGTLMAIASTAGAVHDTGVFQLDGNAQKSLDSNPTAVDDWDVICAANPATCTFASGYVPPSGTTSATTSAHIFDGAQNASIFTTGGSKDPQDLSNWKWKDQTGGLPDKDNLQHSFAARYNIDAGPTCPNGPGPVFTGKCSLLYFGSDRFDNSGDAQEGFWFFQNPVSLKADGTFDGVHANGDLLILSDFSNGGGTSTINIYKWQSGGLQFLTGGATSKCGGSSPDAFCGIVNPSDGTVAPWQFTDKSGNHSYLNGELYEGGVNLSDPSINLANECFSSFLSETRSSTSTTATLKDFVLGQFSVCGAGIVTTPSATVAAPVTPGTSVTDSAVIQGTGVALPPPPTGTVTFFLCGPTALTSSALCSTGGTNIGTGALNDTSPPAGESTAVSPAVNTAASVTGVLAPGRYCFRSEWPGDNTYKPTPPATKFSEFGTGNSECFAVKDTSTVTTAQRWLPNDRATVKLSDGTTNGSGTVTFTLYESADCTGTAKATFPDIALVNGVATSNNTSVYTDAITISWRVTFTPSDTNAVVGSTSHCETSSLTINNDIGS